MKYTCSLWHCGCGLLMSIMMASTCFSGEDKKTSGPRFGDPGVPKEGARPSEVKIRLHVPKAKYPLSKPAWIKKSQHRLVEKAYMYNASAGDIYDLDKIMLYDDQGVPLPKTRDWLANDRGGDPNWPLAGSVRGCGLAEFEGHDLNLSRYAVIDRPGRYRIVGLYRLTFWEDDWAVSDIVEIEFVDDGSAVESAAQKQQGTGAGTDGKKWGQPFLGIVLSARPTKQQFVLGEPVEIAVTVGNIGTNAVELKHTGDVFHDFRPVLFTGDGKHIEVRRWQYERQPVAVPSDGPRPKLKSDVKLSVGGLADYTIRLQDWYDLGKEGAYQLVVARRVDIWEIGFPVSNLTTFEIVSPSGATAGAGEEKNGQRPSDK